jgi:Gas vesicle protein.
MPRQVSSARTADVTDLVERILDKGIVIVGDIKINLVDVELLTIKIRLLIASVDKAKSLGIDWWETDPFISSQKERKAIEEQEERNL